jgi:hypothetical protein
MLVVLLAGGGMGWLVHKARVQCRAVAAIEAAGGDVSFDWEYDALPTTVAEGRGTPETPIG